MLNFAGYLPSAGMPIAGAQEVTQTRDVRLGQNFFRVPIDYFSPRMTNPTRGAAAQLEGFMRLALWMPSGLSVERDVALSLDLRQHKEPIGADRRFIVVIVDVMATNDANAVPPPEQQLRNVLGLGTETFDYDRSFGLLHIVPHKTGPDVRQYYYGSANFSVNYLIHCDKDPSNKPNPLCDGDIRFGSVGLTGHLIFPAEEISQIESIANTWEKLLKSWHVS